MKTPISYRIGSFLFERFCYIFSHVPYSSWKMVKDLIPSNMSILDVGCADGDMMKITGANQNHYSLGADIFVENIIKAKRDETHTDFLCCDARYLPFRRQEFDIVLCLEVIEHLNSKNEGINMIAQLESIANYRVIVSTPVGLTEQHGYGGNKFQEHNVGWYVDEMESMGYECFAVGLRELPVVGLTKRKMLDFSDKVVPPKNDTYKQKIYTMKLMDLLLRIPYYLLGGVVNKFSYQKSGHMICTKEIRNTSKC